GIEMKAYEQCYGSGQDNVYTKNRWFLNEKFIQLIKNNDFYQKRVRYNENLVFDPKKPMKKCVEQGESKDTNGEQESLKRTREQNKLDKENSTENIQSNNKSMKKLRKQQLD
ncbi:unnamed protein product, partial [Didymodactylos carnosus]